MRDSVTEDTGFTARGRRCLPPLLFLGLGDTSVLQDGRSLSQAAGAWPAACLVGVCWLGQGQGQDCGQAISEQDQGGCSWCSCCWQCHCASGAPPEPISSLISRQTAIKASNHCITHGQSLGWGHARTKGFYSKLDWYSEPFVKRKHFSTQTTYYSCGKVEDTTFFNRFKDFSAIKIASLCF